MLRSAPAASLAQEEELMRLLPTSRRRGLTPRRTSTLATSLIVLGLLGSACNLGTPAITPPADELGVVTIPAGEKIHIAFWGVITGADASLGVDSQRGVELAIADRGGKLLGHDVLLTSEDALCTPEGGATAAAKLAADNTVVGLIGSTCSDETVGGIAAITAAGQTTISPSNTRPALSDPGRDATYAGYLRTAHSDAFQGKAVAEFVYNELGLRTMATIHDGSAYAEALQQVAVDNFIELGGTVTAQEAVQKGQTDMSAVLTTVAASNSGAAPDVLYFPIFTAEGGFIAAQVRDVAGMEDVVLIGSDGLFSGDFVAAAGPNAEGMYLSSPDFSKFPAGYAGFVSKYEAKFGEKPIQIFHAHAYDAANILMNAIEKVAIKSGETVYIGKKALRDAIYATKDFAGITGTLTCGQYGDCGAPVIAVYQITAREVGGEWPPEAPIWPQ
jgi:branched-chain amino acid transport system substrate-binding protein